MKKFIWGLPKSEPRPRPLVVAGGTLQCTHKACVRPCALMVLILTLIWLLGFPVGPQTYLVATAPWGTGLPQQQPQPHSPTSHLLPGPGMTQIENMCPEAERLKGWGEAGVGAQSGRQRCQDFVIVLPWSFSL